MESVKIILAEADPIIATEIEGILIEMGHQVMAVVHTGEAAVRQAEFENPDLVIMDVRLNDTEKGNEAGRMIYTQVGIPVIFLFGKNDEGYLEQAIQSSPFGCFPKPIQKRDLGLVIEIVKHASGIDTERRRAVEELSESQKRLKESNDRLMVILDSIPADIYVSDMETYEILYMNAQMKRSFGKDLTGKTCWEVFRDLDEPCPHCNNPQLLDENGKPTGIKIWEGSLERKGENQLRNMTGIE